MIASNRKSTSKSLKRLQLQRSKSEPEGLDRRPEVEDEEDLEQEEDRVVHAGFELRALRDARRLGRSSGPTLPLSSPATGSRISGDDDEKKESKTTSRLSWLKRVLPPTGGGRNSSALETPLAGSSPSTMTVCNLVLFISFKGN